MLHVHRATSTAGHRSARPRQPKPPPDPRVRPLKMPAWCRASHFVSRTKTGQHCRLHCGASPGAIRDDYLMIGRVTAASYLGDGRDGRRGGDGRRREETEETGGDGRDTAWELQRVLLRAFFAGSPSTSSNRQAPADAPCPFHFTGLQQPAYPGQLCTVPVSSVDHRQSPCHELINAQAVGHL